MDYLFNYVAEKIVGKRLFRNPSPPRVFDLTPFPWVLVKGRGKISWEGRSPSQTPLAILNSDTSGFLDLSDQDGVTQIERPDHDTQYDFPPYQIGIANGEEPAAEPKKPCEATRFLHIPAPSFFHSTLKFPLI